jgi:uncharacterized membrane protein
MEKKLIPIRIGRLEAFSDGVIAIIITLMILVIKIPDIPFAASGREIWNAWLNVLPQLIAYILSFVVIGVLWVNHHQFFHQLKHLDRKLLWYNLHLLFWMCIIPLPTAFLGEHFEKPEATALYGFNMFMTAFAFAIMREYVHKNEHLLIENLSTKMRKKLRVKVIAAASLYFLSIFTGYISIYISITIFILVIAAYFMPQNIILEPLDEKKPNLEF